ncbi:MAG: flippase [bacterium]|nr:flippase [bacterium]
MTTSPWGKSVLSGFLSRLVPSSLAEITSGTENRRKISSNTAWLFGDRVVRMGAGLVVGVWLARYLGPESFGVYSYAIAFTFLFSPIRSLGLERVAVRELVKRPGDAGPVMASSMLPMLIGGVAAFAAAGIAVGVIRPGDATVRSLVLAVAAGMIFQSFDVVDYYNQSRVESRFTVLPKGLVFLAASASKVALIVAGASVVAFGWVYGAELLSAAAALTIVYLMRRDTPALNRWRPALGQVRELLADSWPLLISSALIVINMRIDQVMMGGMLGDRQVGIYSVAVRLTELWYFIPIILQSTLMPSIVRAGEVSRALLDRRMHSFYRLMSGLAYMIIVPMWLLADRLVLLLFGEAYVEAVPMLRWLLITVLFVNLGLARTAFLTTMNWTRLHMASSVLGALINVALNLILIPVYGGMGAVTASLIAYWVQVHGACFLFPALRGTGLSMLRAMVLMPASFGDDLGEEK